MCWRGETTFPSTHFFLNNVSQVVLDTHSELYIYNERNAVKVE